MAHRLAVSAVARVAAATPRVRPALAVTGRTGGLIPVDALQSQRRQNRRDLHSTSPLLTGGAPKRAACDHAKVEAVFEKILNLDLVEVHLVTMLLAEKMGVSATGAPVGAGDASMAGEGGAAAKEEAPAEVKTKFDLKLVGFDPKAKIKVIKEVRTMAGLGLKEAKEMVEGAPKVVLKDIKKEEIEEMKTKLEAIGAEVEFV